MTEKTFQRELAAALRISGCWVAKWPDMPVSAMRVGKSGQLRFAIPKPADLIGCTGAGRCLLIECKLARTPIFRVDARLIRQLDTLRALQELGAFAALALNFRFVRQRPRRRVNRALLFLGLSGEAWIEGRTFVLALTPPFMPDFMPEPKPAAPMPLYIELARISGGWKIPAFLLGGFQASPAPASLEFGSRTSQNAFPLPVLAPGGRELHAGVRDRPS